MDKNEKRINKRINDKELISVCSSFLEFSYNCKNFRSFSQVLWISLKKKKKKFIWNAP